MGLDVTQPLRNPGEPIAFTYGQTVPQQDIMGDTITFDDPVMLEGLMVYKDQAILLTATLNATVHAHCANCLNDVAKKFAIPVEEILYDEDAGPLPQHVEEDDEPFTFRGMQADIEHLVFTNLLLALPIRFLCRKNCRGMLDEQDAGQDPPHNPFSVLNQLLLKDEEV